MKVSDFSTTISDISISNEMEGAAPILEKLGWTAIGAGYYGAVYSKPGTKSVLKLFDSRDRGYREYLDLIETHPNPHFPRVSNKVVQVTNRYWAICMERLLPAPEAISLAAYVICRKDGPNPHNPYQAEAYHKAIKYFKTHQSLKVAVDLIADKLLVKYSSDLHKDNVMKRANGTLVIIDPTGFAK